MPAGPNTPSLAESWSQSKDGLTYEFVLRKGVKFHNGDPVTAADVKFSFERYKGSGAKLLKERVREVQIVDPGRVRFHLKEPWPDFMTFYGTTAGAGWSCRPVEGWRRRLPEGSIGAAPIGSAARRCRGRAKAFEGYWRRSQCQRC
jgi:peptide/nickel transport system substrate-binding protein